MTEKIKTNETKNSILLLHISVMLFGLSAVFGRFVDVPAVCIAGGRVIWSSITLFILLRITKTNLKLKNKRDYIISACTGVVLAGHWTTFFMAIQSASVAIGTITFSAFPLFLTFFEPLVFHEKLRKKNIFSAFILLIGVGITIPSFSFENKITMGIVWGLISALSYAIMSLANRYLSGHYEARLICFYEQGTATIFLLPSMFLIPAKWTFQSFMGVAAIGLVCTAVAHSLYVAAQKNVKAQTAGIISSMETVYGILFAFLFLKEAPGLREIIGGIIILGVAVFSSLTSSKNDIVDDL